MTQNIMTLTYAAWMGLTWNGFHALKWAMLDMHLISGTASSARKWTPLSE